MILAIVFWMGFNHVMATPITIQISGKVTSVAGTGRESVPDTIYIGVGFTGTYTYDSDTLDSDPSDHNGIYQHNSPYGISIELGGYEFKTAPNHTDGFEMQISNDSSNDIPRDYYTVFSNENISTLPDGFSIWYISWGLNDSTHNPFSSDILPITVPVLTDWDYNRLEITGVDSLERGIVISGTVTKVTPEPLTGILMAMGLLFMRRKQ